ncbi:uncharacterized protein LOC132161630 [Corylus avellana]|uniref:uncharacterized protein LOC132161630 n=1 Tax=Corylus avellana TaxID=13451 RepID=UPI001E1F1527|nr:uncharacterized protein LOC132161630 [Corylus avellana]
MISVSMEDGKCSDTNMEGDGGLRTVECLRGRLVAERQASRLAKENAELLGNKLMELENQLKEETKQRNKAEKKLKILMKKLESLNITTISVESEQSSSSENCKMSCRSSTSTSDSKDPEEDELKSQFTSPEISQTLQNNASETSASTPILSSPSSEKDSQSNSNLNDPSQETLSDKMSSTSEYPKADSRSYSSLKSSLQENESNHEDDVDNSLALVPVDYPASSQAAEMKPLNESVSEVLDALRHAREKLQSSIQGRRHMIQVGST